MPGKICKTPLYTQVRDRLAERIQTGQWKCGSPLPNEMELAKELGVSPGTVRKALRQLGADRLVVRRQGRGTFVLDQASGELAIRFSNIRTVHGQRIPEDVQLLEQCCAVANEREREHLKLPPGDAVIRTRRLRSQDGRPFMYEEASLAVGLFPGLNTGSVGNYPISALAQSCGLHLGKAIEHVTVGQATRVAAGHLAVDLHAPVLLLNRVVYSISGREVEWRLGFCDLADQQMYVARMR